MDVDQGLGGAEEPAHLAAEVAALAARVTELERQLAKLTRRTLPTAPFEVTAREFLSRRRDVPTGAATVSEPPPPPFPAPAPSSPHRQTFENRLGSQVFNVVAVVAIIVGTSLFLKLVIDRGWLGPSGRVIIGLVAGAGLVVWSERFRHRGFGAFSYSLKALGSAVLYLSLWAAFHLYALLPASVALAAMLLVTAWNGYMAWSQDAELLAAYGLVGGFATPLLLSTGGDHETFLFTYLGALDAVTVLLVRRKPWHRLLLPAYAATAAYFIGWYAGFFHPENALGMDGQSWETCSFALLFFAIFAAASLRGFVQPQAGNDALIVPVLLPLANAAFVSLALYSVLQDSGLHSVLAFLMVALAAVFLLLSRMQSTSTAAAMHLCSAVVFLTVAIPLKASGHTLTTAWLVEGLVLVWASRRAHGESAAPSRILEALAAGSYALGLGSLAFHWIWHDQGSGFFNHDLGSSLVAVAALSGAAWLSLRPLRRDPAILLAALLGLDFVGLLLCLREVAVSRFLSQPHAAFANAEFAAALVGLTVLACASALAYRIAETPDTAFHFALPLAGGTLVLFNLLAILSGVREITALWPLAADDLQRSLAVSAFLMLYGGLLLAAGFLRRNSFVRWQALVLLLFTIAKVFLYDISGLSEGYRVVSFLTLGVLLLAISFAYQKDWLGLKAPASGTDQGES